MDTSKEFIKMCEKAEKLQRDLLNGDYWCWSGEADVQIAIGDGGEHKSRFGTRVILFRQDQLQAMRPNKISLAYADLHYAVMDGFYDGYIAKDGFGYGTPYETDEQLWLAFVMLKRYGKIWDGTDWIKKECNAK